MSIAPQYTPSHQVPLSTWLRTLFTAKRLFILSVVALVGSVFFLGMEVRDVSARTSRDDSSLFSELKTFTDVLSIIQRDYVSTVENRKLVEGAIKGMLTTLDPHSSYLDPDFYQDLKIQTKGEFGGLGIEITARDGLIVVVSPMEDSPAERAGLKSGDSIVKIGDKFTKDLSLAEAVKKLRGPKGSSVTVSLLRKGSSALIEATLVRGSITVKSVKKRALGDGYGYIRISQFMEKTFEDLTTAIEKLRKDSPQREVKGLILDLRNNPGGLLTQAVKISDLFLREGVIVYTDGRMESQKQKYYAHERNTEPDYPLIVLVNGGSASASEIVAGALQDHGRALVLGSQTFGKGSVQTVMPLSNGGALTLTTALYYTKSTRSIQLTGVTPDIEMADPAPVILPVATTKTPLSLRTREGDLPGAIKNPSQQEILRPQSDSKSDVSVPVSSLPEPSDPPLNIETADLKTILAKDLILARAVELLRTFQPGADANGADS